MMSVVIHGILKPGDSNDVGDKYLAKYILHVPSGICHLKEFVFQ